MSGGGALGRLSASASAKGARERHVALAVPLRAVERNRRVAASVLAGGFGYSDLPVVAAVRPDGPRGPGSSGESRRS